MNNLFHTYQQQFPVSLTLNGKMKSNCQSSIFSKKKADGVLDSESNG